MKHSKGKHILPFEQTWAATAILPCWQQAGKLVGHYGQKIAHVYRTEIGGISEWHFQEGPKLSCEPCGIQGRGQVGG